ncbi:MAG: heme exporter protein CcmB [Saprospiraceae bacterium]
MNYFQSVYFLIKKEITLELRQKYALSGILLYVLATVFIVYLSLVQVQKPVWSALFWIIILFASINAVAKSFVQENSQRALYYYTLAEPSAILISKIVYNFLLLTVLCFLTFGVFGVVAGQPVKEIPLFMTTLMLGSLGFSITLTFISAIAGKANNGSTLMAIMGFPVVIPILILLVKLTATALRLIQDTSNWKDMVSLLAIDTILLALAFALFPFLWRD